jgi:hypothetical protein
MSTSESDRSLLELAAKAAGLWHPRYELSAAGHGNIYHNNGIDPSKFWNPLIDDGDAFRLAVQLGLIINFSPREDRRSHTVVIHSGLSIIEESCDNGREAAARRASVGAAAAIGERGSWMKFLADCKSEP